MRNGPWCACTPLRSAQIDTACRTQFDAQSLMSLACLVLSVRHVLPSCHPFFLLLSPCPCVLMQGMNKRKKKIVWPCPSLPNFFAIPPSSSRAARDLTLSPLPLASSLSRLPLSLYTSAHAHIFFFFFNRSFIRSFIHFSFGTK